MTYESLQPLFQYIRNIGKFSLYQCLIIIINLASGILIIRLLSTEDFAIFSLALLGFNTLNLLSNLGILQAMLALGGEVWQYPDKLGEVISCGLKTRKTIFLFLLFLIMPFQCFLIYKHSTSLSLAILFFFLIIPDSYFVLTTEFFLVGAKLHKDTNLIQRSAIFEAIIKLLLLCFGVFFQFYAWIIYGIKSLASFIRYEIVKKNNSKFFLLQQSSNPAIQSQILTTVKHTLPMSLYYCLQGQIGIWLISLFGTTANIAEFSALSKIMLVFALFDAILSSIILPTFAKIKDPKILLNRFLLFCSCLLGMFVIIFWIALRYSSLFLWILGKNYQALNEEFIYALISAFSCVLLTSIMGINLSRNWVKYLWVYIPLTLATQVVILYFVHIDSVKNVFLFNIISTLPQILIAFCAFGWNYLDFKGRKIK
ncbi:MAG: hypothetical protein KKB51_23875 [Candidatus Riflebacteria bacterium]|nr:hypothetical protein [Candidatus Riflebacteria bacterium]